MKTKNFETLLSQRLNKKEIAEIEKAALIEYEVFISLREDIAKTVVHYMSVHNIGFNELARKLGKSPSQVSKIIKGEANLTLSSIAQLYALMGVRPHIVAA